MPSITPMISEMRAALPWTAPIAALASRAAARPGRPDRPRPGALAGGQRLGRVLARRGRELLHRGRGFLQAGCLFLGATRQIMVAGGDLARRAFDRGGPGLHLTHRAAQSFAHPVQRRQQPGRLVAPCAARARSGPTRPRTAPAPPPRPAARRSSARSARPASAASARTTSTLHSAICSRPIRSTSRSSSPVASAVAPSISRYNASSCAVALPK